MCAGPPIIYKGLSLSVSHFNMTGAEEALTLPWGSPLPDHLPVSVA